MEDAEKIRHNGMHRCAFEYGSLVDLYFDRSPAKSGRRTGVLLDRGMTNSLYYEDPGSYDFLCVVAT
jgi:hypothetical protein